MDKPNIKIGAKLDTDGLKREWKSAIDFTVKEAEAGAIKIKKAYSGSLDAGYSRLEKETARMNNEARSGLTTTGSSGWDASSLRQYKQAIEQIRVVEQLNADIQQKALIIEANREKVKQSTLKTEREQLKVAQEQIRLAELQKSFDQKLTNAVRGKLSTVKKEIYVDKDMEKALADIAKYKASSVKMENDLTKHIQQQSETQYQARINQYQRGLKEFEKLNKQIQSSNGSSASSGWVDSFIGNFASNAVSKAIQLTTELAQGIFALGQRGVQMAADFESTTNALSVYAGGLSSARQELTAVDEAARNTTGLRLIDAEKGYQQLRALNFEAETAKNLVTGLGKQKLLSNADDGAVQRVIVNFTQLSTSTARFSADMREIIHAMPTLRTAIFEAFGTTDNNKLKKFFDDNPDEAIKKLADAMAKTQGASGGLNDAIGKLEDSWVKAGRAFGEPLLDELTIDAKILTDSIYDNLSTFEHWGEGVADTIRGVRKILQERDNNTGSFSSFFDSLGAKINEYNPAYQAVKSVQKIGAQESYRNVPISIDADSSSIGSHQKEVAAQIRQSKREEAAKKEQLDMYKAFFATSSAIYASGYQVLEAQLKNHLTYTLQDERNNITFDSGLKAASIKGEIERQRNNYDVLLGYEKDDIAATTKLKAEKNKVLAELNNKFKINELNTQKEIAEKERQILEQRRQDLSAFKSIQLQQAQADLSFYTSNVKDKTSESISNAESAQLLIALNNNAYKEITQTTKEQFELQLQNERLTAQQRINIERQMYFDLQKLARDNSRTILQIQEEQVEKINERLTTSISNVTSGREFQRQLTGNIFDSVFGGNNLSLSGIDKTISSLRDNSANNSLTEKLTADLKDQIRIKKDAVNEQRKLTEYNINSYRNQYSADPKTLKDKIDIEQIYFNNFLSNNQNLQKEIQKTIDATVGMVSGESVRLSASADKLNDAYKSLFSGGINSDTIDKINAAKIKQKFGDELADLGNEIKEKLAGINALKEQNNPLRDGAVITKSQTEINELLKQKTFLTQEQGKAEQEAYSNSNAGLREYLGLLQSGDPLAVAAIQHRAINSELQRQIGLYDSITESQVSLAQKGSFSPLEANAQFLDFLNQNSKSLTEIYSSTQIGVVTTFWDVLDGKIHSVKDALKSLSDVFRNLLTDWLKMATTNLFSGQQSAGGGAGGANGIRGIVQNLFNGGNSSGINTSGTFGSGSIGGGGYSFANTGASLATGTLSTLANGQQAYNVFGGGSDSFNIAPANFADTLNSIGLGSNNGRGNSTSQLSGYSQIKSLLGGGAAGGLGILAPILGASLGGLLGGQSKTGNILGSIGGLAGGVAALGILAPSALAGLFGAAGLGLGASLTAASIATGVGIVAAPLLLLGSYLLGKNKQRRSDETARNTLMVDTLKQLNDIKSQMEAAKSGIDIQGLINNSHSIQTNYFTQANTLKDKKTRNIAIKDGHERVDPLVAQIEAAAVGAKLKQEIESQNILRDRRLLPEFASGVYMDSGFRNQYNDFKKYNGLMSGAYDSTDNIKALIGKGEMVLNPRQIEAIRRSAGFDVFANAQIPNYSPKAETPRFATGVNLSAPSFSSSSAPQQDAKQPIIIHIHSETNIDSEGIVTNVLKISEDAQNEVKVIIENASKNNNLYLKQG